MEYFKMDGRYNKPQFNVSLFNKQVHVIINQRFAELLKSYVDALDEETKSEWVDFSDAISEATATKSYRSDNDNPEYVITEFNGVMTIAMENEMAEHLSRLILDRTTDVCKKNPEIEFNAFIAFGRRLETAARGDHESLHTQKRMPMPPMPLYPHQMPPVYYQQFPPRRYVR